MEIAGVTQLVEFYASNVDVASASLAARSKALVTQWIEYSTFNGKVTCSNHVKGIFKNNREVYIMYADVLVLNRSYVAIHVISWQKCLTLLVSEKADVIDEEYRRYSFLDWKDLSAMMTDNPSGFVRSPSCKIAVPDVIILKTFDRLPSSDVKFTRRNIYKHYENKCCYCGHKYDTSELNLDHVFPKSRGGKTDWLNIVLSCIKCNTDKANRTPREAGLTMNYSPTKPTWHNSFSGRISALAHNRMTWKRFIDALYWESEIGES